MLLADLVENIEPTKLRLFFEKIKMTNLVGQFLPVHAFDTATKSIIMQDYAYSEWARIALDVANQYGGGDYFEFGSEGLNTLCNFLTTFHFNGHDKNFPNTRFFAFDVFGDPEADKTISKEEKVYFKAYSKGKNFYQEMQNKLSSYKLMNNRVELIKGYFKNTLNDSFKMRLINENRKVGFAFLDCNIAPSYETALNFLEEFMHPAHSFI
jgi:hypothetical protein